MIDVLILFALLCLCLIGVAGLVCAMAAVCSLADIRRHVKATERACEGMRQGMAAQSAAYPVCTSHVSCSEGNG